VAAEHYSRGADSYEVTQRMTDICPIFQRLHVVLGGADSENPLDPQQPDELQDHSGAEEESDVDELDDAASVTGKGWFTWRRLFSKVHSLTSHLRASASAAESLRLLVARENVGHLSWI